MTIKNKLAASLNRKDEQPNIELAQQIAATNNKKAVEELFEILNSKNKALENDCIKVVYEVGVAKPAMIAGYSAELIKLLESKNNRLQWGAMTALSAITNEKPDLIFKGIPQIIAAADKGSVITNDQCVEILIKLCAVKNYAAKAFELLIKRIEKSSVNQLAMYAERSMHVTDKTNVAVFIKTLQKRLPEIEKESKRKRVEKIIKKSESK